MGLIPVLVMCTMCSGSPAPKSGAMPPAYRPAFLVGDQVSVVGGEYAQSAGTVIEVDMDADVYRVRLSDRSNPVFIRSILLRKYTTPKSEVLPSRGTTSILPTIPPRPALPSTPPPSAAPVQEKPRTETGSLGRLAVLPIIGLEEYVAETLAWHFANEEMINSNFSVVPITPHIRKNVMSEESYSAIYNAGEDLNADYILTSFARVVGFQKIFITQILNVETREQLAGDFKIYEDVQDIPTFFSMMSKRITGVIRQKPSNLPKLSVELMAVPPNTALKNDAVVLTQLFAITMANTNAYSIFPRNDHIDAAMLDYETRRTTAQKVFIDKDSITAADFVLSSKIDIFDTKNQMLAEIVDISGNVLRKGTHIDFDSIEDIPRLLGRLATNLTGTTASGRPQTASAN